MSRAEREELEQLVLLLERQHPDWSASEIEAELSQRVPVAHGNWRSDTPNLRARLRQVQRWRTGSTASGRPLRTKLSYTFLWPMGERQRRTLEPSYPARERSRRASHRLFLYNCSTETVRELRAKMGAVEVTYDPALSPGAFAEIHWTRDPTIRSNLLAAKDHQVLQHALEVEFAVSNGTKRACLRGILSLDATDGWTAFRGSDGTEKEIE